MKKQTQSPEEDRTTTPPKSKKTASEVAYEKLFQDMVDEFRNNYQPSHTPEGCDFMTTASIIEMWETIVPGLNETTVNTFMVEAGFTTKLIGGEFKWLVRAVKSNNLFDY